MLREAVSSKEYKRPRSPAKGFHRLSARGTCLDATLPPFTSSPILARWRVLAIWSLGSGFSRF